tara:strand:+ start:4088 stop:5086 length:999 start_codon:yes stop_codon:yes gene_type:complete
VDKGFDLVVCKFSSWFHLVSILSYLEGLNTRPATVVFFQDSFMGRRAPVDESVLLNCADNVFFFTSFKELDGFFCTEVGLDKASATRMALVTPSKRPYRFYRLLKKYSSNVSFTLTEEGLGSYGGILQDVRACVREDLGGSLMPLAVKYMVASILIVGLDLYFSLVERRREVFFLFDRALVINEDVKSRYLKTIQRLVPENYIFLRGQSFVLVLTPPVVELGVLSKDEFLICLSELRDSCQMDGEFVIKPHPVEELEKYSGLSVLPAGIPAEWVLTRCSDQISGVVTPSSTSAYLAKALFGREVVRFAGFDPLYNTLSRRQQRLVSSGRLWQ